MNDNNILGVVLAGGKSVRFGEDKNQVKLGKLTLLEHVLIKIIDQFEEVLIVSNHNVKYKKNLKIHLVGDYKNDLGPLAGVLSAMKWIKEKSKKYKWIVTFPSDTPFFDKSIIGKFKESAKDNKSSLYFIRSNKKRHNIFGLWSIDLMETLENDLIKKDLRKIEDWANKIGVKVIDIKNDEFDSFLNINTKEDLEKAKKILEKFKND